MPTNLKHHVSVPLASFLRVALAAVATAVMLTGPSYSGEVDSERDEEFPIAFVGSVRETGTLKPIPGVQVRAEVGTWRLLVRTNSEGVYKLYPAFGPDIKSDQIAISCAKEGYDTVDVQRRRLTDQKVKELIVAECLMAPKK
jgi:hypothetical protein